MQYLLLVYMDEPAWNAMPPAEKEQVFVECGAYANEMTRAGSFLAGSPLQPSATARTIRRTHGQPLVTDGPFAETKEVLAGYHLVEAGNMAEAVALGARFPGLKVGLTIEVRPLHQLAP